jgi:hypothetical protein
MTARKSVFILKLGAQILCVRNTLLYTYKHLLGVTTVGMQAKFPCYNTFNNRLRVVGSVMELQTEMGTFTVEHHPLLLTKKSTASSEG